MRVLFIGDIVGRSGRRAVRELLPSLKRELAVDFVIANGENAAGGIGINPEKAEELFTLGVDVITTGNHVWKKREVLPYLE
ncbi:MAG: metallophosphoesterase, partial [Deltaproteobacteria bacterium]